LDAANIDPSGTTWPDAGGQKQDATLTGTSRQPTWSSANGGVLTFVGGSTNQYAYLPAGFDDFTSGITIMAFVRFESANNWERILDFGNGDEDNNILLARAGTSNDLRFDNYTGTTLSLPITTLDGGISNTDWGFYAIRLDGLSYKILNQLTNSSGPSSALPTNVVRTNKYIGRSNWAGDAYFAGKIGIIAIYNTALSDSDITAFYDLYKTRYFSVPGVPTSVSATAGNTQATVSFTTPSNTGGLPITSYTVTSNPDGITASGSSSPITVTGLTNDISYTFTVVATNALGDSSPSTASVPVTPQLPIPGPPVGTQLLLNHEFTEITNNGADGWASSRGWQAYSGISANSPTAVLTMPIRTDVYAISDTSGFVIFSYISATVSQTVAVPSLTGINTITGVLNIVNTNNNATDTFTFQIQYKNNAGTVLYTTTTGNINAPNTWTDYTLTLTRATSPNFDLIKVITVNITGIDSGFWNGQYGPAMDYCTLTVT
jgi:hypothetical protein